MWNIFSFIGLDHLLFFSPGFTDLGQRRDRIMDIPAGLCGIIQYHFGGIDIAPEKNKI